MQPGQIGVVVGRAMCMGGLRVMNYRPKLCRKHPKCVCNFYETYDTGESVVVTSRAVFIRHCK